MRKGQLKTQPHSFIRDPHQLKAPTGGSGSAMAFSFGDPETVLTNNLTDYLGMFVNPNGDYWEPPVSQSGLAKLLRANGHHGTIAYFKRNMLCRWYKDNDVLSREELGKAGFDLEVFGNGYLQILNNRKGQPRWLRHLPAINMRRMKEADRYCMLRPGKDPLPFKAGEVVHIKEYDPMQQIYGVPQYLGGIQSVLLNEDATMFRRKYYKNGAHMGYIFYMADPNLDEKDENAIKEKVTQSKGVGNFRSMFINIPDGKPESVKIIPVGDIATKDEFERVKNLTRSDVLAMWRINGALAGILPENNSGFGDLDKISRNNYENEVIPVQQKILQLNDHLPRHLNIGFESPKEAA
ncbi:phage portal protein [Pseudomaricurvus alkylphenolicus]|uniref:phage portal protein n=1 Tax=Pseudomaricurvus alkylphenolicus TaxID=1306991 RepID=UPI00141DEA90|nr:phage portal protein [Pseudomaricurvus alkylphenolicus]NIB44786.1 phage portal protein [Pseudomaricurvus alkylphenolicus]